MVRVPQQTVWGKTFLSFSPILWPIRCCGSNSVLVRLVWRGLERFWRNRASLQPSPQRLLSYLTFCCLQQTELVIGNRLILGL